MVETLAFQTFQSTRGTYLKESFEIAVKNTFRSYTVDMTAPEDSTGGGVRARQHIRLRSHDGAVNMVIGFANAAEGTAELNTLGHTLYVSKVRFGTELKIPPSEYLRFLDRATKILENFGLSVSSITCWRAS
jgi:hypothetical protein